MSMRSIRQTSYLAAILMAVFLAGCGTMGDVLGGGDRGDRRSDRGTYDPYDQSLNDLRGTVERVDTRDRLIVVDAESSYRRDLRNERDEEVILYYDDSTVVEFQGQTYHPRDLEPGDRIAADVERSGSRLVARDIQVLYDVTGGEGDRYDDRYGRDDRNDRNDRYDRYGDRDEASAYEVRGTVRYVDTRDQILEVERTGTLGRSGEVLRLKYDAATIVEYQGRRYQPENLERGDVVEVEVRDLGRDLLAEEILVVSDARSSLR